MLVIAVESNNLYYRKGLLYLMEEIKSTKALKDYCILENESMELSSKANIILTDNTAIINILNENDSKAATNTRSLTNSAIHITFNAATFFLDDFHSFILRLFSAASLPSEGVENSDFYRHLKIRKSAQLSDPEKRLVMLSGHGHDIINIAKIMRCSTNSSYTYRRNAMKKLGMDNRLQFYKYVQILTHFQQHNNVFVCL